MAIFSIALLLVTPILLVAALAVRFAGNRRVLNSIDYSTVTDPAGLNRWSGNRLFLLPALSLFFGVLSLSRPALSIIGGGIVVLATVLVVVWIAAGSDRFRARR
jgi:hypothetical protein